ncbi:MAG: TlpA family protein disulfide reductase [Rhizobium sp.]|nr:TlpA family protein disulfide reductase [Rhizobium sp.]
MKRDAILTWGAIVVLGGLSAWLGWWLGQRALMPDEKPAPPGMVITEVGQPVPGLALPDLRSGELVTVSGPGRTRLINYWASWCGPCRKEMPVLDAYARQQGGNGVKVVGIALESPDEALAFLREVPVEFTLLVENPGPGDSSVQLGNRRGILPYTVLLDASGTLLATHYGAFPDPESVQAWVNSNAR